MLYLMLHDVVLVYNSNNIIVNCEIKHCDMMK